MLTMTLYCGRRDAIRWIQGYAVQSPERMVADCDECTFRQIVKHLFVVDSKCVVELLEQQPSPRESGPGCRSMPNAPH